MTLNFYFVLFLIYIDICINGSYYEEVTRRCELCPTGYYQSEAGMKTCQYCSNGQTTEVQGATSIDQCQGDVQLKIFKYFLPVVRNSSFIYMQVIHCQRYPLSCKLFIIIDIVKVVSFLLVLLFLECFDIKNVDWGIKYH